MASIVESILNEFREEVPATRRMLERVPGDKLAWKPHPKSRSLGELALHVANIFGLAEKIVSSDEFAAGIAPPAAIPGVEEIRAAFEKNARNGEEALGKLTEQSALGSWRLVFKGKELTRKTRVAALRTNMLNHMYHHRGQLSVYLRLLDVPVPVVYGPTADENPFA
ncbi:MAG TPA: DinB family protein [Candidatus Acidoferrales bacterium]|nr:DinB family protein [Candidatus Acidoferrales bacterium]